MIITYPLNGILYDATAAESYHAVRESGVFSATDNFQIAPIDGNSVMIQPGLAWIKNERFAGKSVCLSAAMEIALPASDPALPRIDRIVLRFSKAANSTSLMVLEGTAASSPSAPAITRTNSVYDLALYEVRRPAGSSSIAVSDITNTMTDESVCGIMRDAVTGIPTAQIQEQALALIADLRSELEGVEAGTAWLLKSVYDANGINMDVYDFAIPSAHYTGRELPYTWAQIKTKVTAGDFSGIHIGDYKTIQLTGGETVVCEVAGIDTYYGNENLASGHHIDWVSRDCLPTAIAYGSGNSGTTTKPPFTNSALYTALNSDIYNTLPSDLRKVIANKYARPLWTYNGIEYNPKMSIGKLWLPTEMEVTGCRWFGSNDGGDLSTQYPIFAQGAKHRRKHAGNGGADCNWWLYTPSATDRNNWVMYSTPSGDVTEFNAAKTARVPVCFRIA